MSVTPMNDTDLRIELARLDERQKALRRDIENTEKSSAAALKIQADELARRLDLLNHDHQNAVLDREKYLPRETFEASRLTLEARANSNSDRISKLELNEREQRGRMWLPMIGIGTLVAAIVAAVVKVAFP